MRKKLSGYIIPLIAIVIFCAVVFWFLAAVDSAENAARSQRAESVKRSIEDGITLCYSIEGAYPSSMDYLAENYGVNYDKECYLVHYNCFASNVRPSVTVIEKER